MIDGIDEKKLCTLLDVWFILISLTNDRKKRWQMQDDDVKKWCCHVTHWSNQIWLCQHLNDHHNWFLHEMIMIWIKYEILILIARIVLAIMFPESQLPGKVGKVWCGLRGSAYTTLPANILDAMRMAKKQ